MTEWFSGVPALVVVPLAVLDGVMAGEAEAVEEVVGVWGLACISPLTILLLREFGRPFRSAASARISLASALGG